MWTLSQERGICDDQRMEHPYWSRLKLCVHAILNMKCWSCFCLHSTTRALSIKSVSVRPLLLPYPFSILKCPAEQRITSCSISGQRKTRQSWTRSPWTSYATSTNNLSTAHDCWSHTPTRYFSYVRALIFANTQYASIRPFFQSSPVRDSNSQPLWTSARFPSIRGTMISLSSSRSANAPRYRRAGGSLSILC